MKLKDKIGTGITNFLYPYIQSYYNGRGDYMKKPLDREEYMLQEKYLWFLGCEDLLADFYQTRTQTYSVIDTREQYYYSAVGSKIRVVHSGLPSLISYSKARLLMSGGIEIRAELKEKEDEKTTELLEAIYDDNKMDSIIKNSVVTESWARKFAWKFSYDSEVSNYPIIEKYNPFEYKALYKRGRLQELIFNNCYEKGKTKYRLDEVYGRGYINYHLYLLTENGEVEVALTELEETALLKDITWNEKVILGGEKCIDKSDYDGIISEFDALDEAWSQLMDEIRLGRSEVYVPEMLLTNKTFNKFRKDFAQLGNDMRENATSKIEHIQPNIRSNEYKNTINLLTSNCITSVGLSPFTVGIDDSVGANASGEQLTKREATSLRTREEMVNSWTEFLEEMFSIILYANSIFGNGKYNKEIDIEVMFGDYITPTRADLINQTKLMVDANIIDSEKALDEIYGDDLAEEEKIRILANLGSLTEPLEPIEE